MKKLTIIGLLGAVFALAGCHTVSGVGQDISATGGALTGAADDTMSHFNDNSSDTRK